MKAVIFFLLGTVIPFSNAPKDKSYYSHWRNNEEIRTMLPSEYTYSEKEKFYYFISNDNDNIYVNLKIFSPEIQNRIFREGFVVWINQDGKKSKKTGIKYPIPTKVRDRGSIPAEAHAPGQGENFVGRRNLQQTPFLNRLELIGFDEAGIVEFTPSDTRNFSGTISMDKEKFMNYELIIPRSKIPKAKGKGSDVQKPLMIGFSFPEATSTYSRGDSGEDQGMYSGGRGGGGRGGGRGGSYGGGTMGSTPSMSSENTAALWISNIILAVEK
jgi:hypothetical protein